MLGSHPHARSRSIGIALIAAAMATAVSCSSVEAEIVGPPQQVPVEAVATSVPEAVTSSTTAPPSTVASTTTTTVPMSPSVQFASPQVITYDRPNGDAVWNLANPGPFDGDLTLQTTGVIDGDWIEVVIPTKPNGTTGWLLRDETIPVDVTTNIVVDLSDRTVTLFDDGVEVKQVDVGIGKPTTPTPTLHAIVDHVAQNANPNGAYGAWILGLNQHSEALETFGGGRPAIALHGTTNPGDIGNEVSNGCIRIENSAISELAPLVPLGTPVEIRA